MSVTIAFTWKKKLTEIIFLKKEIPTAIPLSMYYSAQIEYICTKLINIMYIHKKKKLMYFNVLYPEYFIVYYTFIKPLFIVYKPFLYDVQCGNGHPVYNIIREKLRSCRNAGLQFPV